MTSGKGDRKRIGFLEVVESVYPLKIKWVAFGTIALFWVLGVWPFIAQFVPAVYDALLTPIGLLADFIILILGLWTLRNKWDIAILVSYILISAVGTILVNHLSVIFWLNGSRFYFGIIFFIPIFRWIFSQRNRAIYFIELLDKSLYIFLWIQVPCMIYEFVVLGGNDQGGGSLGNYMSGVISGLIYIISFYLMLRRWDNNKNYLSNLLANWTLVFLLCPTFMNETKISFIYLLLYFILLVPFNKKFLVNLLICLPFIALGAGGALYLYFNTQVDTQSEKLFSIEYLEYYVMGDDQTYDIMESLLEKESSDEDRDFMRGAKLLMLPTVVMDQPHGLWIGYGTSQYKGQSVLEQTDFYKRYQWFLFGTSTLLMMVLIDMGIAGLIWLLFAFAVMFGWVGQKKRQFKGQLQWFMGLQCLIQFPYAANITLPIYALVFIYITMISSRWNRVEEARRWECDEEPASIPLAKGEDV